MSAPVTMGELVWGANQLIRQISRSNATHRGYPHSQLTATDSQTWVTVVDECPEGTRRSVTSIMIRNGDSSFRYAQVRVKPTSTATDAECFQFDNITVGTLQQRLVWAILYNTYTALPEINLLPGQSLEARWPASVGTEGLVLANYDEVV